MSVLYHKVIIEDMENNGFTENEIDRLEFTFGNKLKKMAASQARYAEFNTDDFASRKGTSLAGLTLTIKLRIDMDEMHVYLWEGRFEGKGKSLVLMATLEA